MVAIIAMEYFCENYKSWQKKGMQSMMKIHNIIFKEA
jgi:hypothetical protein